MKKEQSLADYLGVPQPGEPDEPVASVPADSVYKIPDSVDAKEFAERFLSSPEFKRYLVSSLTLGEIPPAVITRMMDYAWGKPVERVEVKTTTVGDVDSLTPAELKARLRERITTLKTLEDLISDDDEVVH